MREDSMHPPLPLIAITPRIPFFLYSQASGDFYRYMRFKMEVSDSEEFCCV
jgi:hypothetical protein